MRRVAAALIVAALAGAVTAPGWADPTPRSATGTRPSHPEEVALVDEGERGFVYRRFPGGQRLYTFAPDPAGRSTCDGGCAAAWPPVPAPADAVRIGRWTVVVRRDGSRQWALDGRPVYTRFHDAPEAPTGDDHRGVWHLVPYTATRDAVPALHRGK